MTDTAKLNLSKFLRCVTILTRDLRLSTLKIKRLLCIKRNDSSVQDHQSSTTRVEEFHEVSPPTNKRKGLSAILKHIEEES